MLQEDQHKHSRKPVYFDNTIFTLNIGPALVAQLNAHLTGDKRLRV